MESRFAPECCCLWGRMLLWQAGTHTSNPGRWYYKCRTKVEHDGDFIWCDVHHRNQPDELKHAYAMWQTPAFSALFNAPLLVQNSSGSSLAAVNGDVPEGGRPKLKRRGVEEVIGSSNGPESTGPQQQVMGPVRQGGGSMGQFPLAVMAGCCLGAALVLWLLFLFIIFPFVVGFAISRH